MEFDYQTVSEKIIVAPHPIIMAMAGEIAATKALKECQLRGGLFGGRRIDRRRVKREMNKARKVARTSYRKEHLDHRV